MTTLLETLRNSLEEHAENVALVIDRQKYTYRQLSDRILTLRHTIRERTREDERNVGLTDTDSFDTYAAILALWFEGKAYVPISLQSPADRNRLILEQTGTRSVIDTSTGELQGMDGNVIPVEIIKEKSVPLSHRNVSVEQTAYILFTSGSTGVPKGVPISFYNLEAFCEAYSAMGISIGPEDRFLQMFELSFDVSVMSYLLPLLFGARFYTIPKDEIKYSYIFDLMEDEKLTNALMVPSIIHYLRPYFDEIESLDLKYSIFCGEALSQDIVEEWAACVPNATVINAYGPTEDTMLCTYYILQNEQGKNKSHNGIISIGKPMEGNETIIIDEAENELPSGSKGELCLAGPQLTTGYINNPEKNKAVFFEHTFNGESKRFYKTGDLCFMDEEGDIMFLGRIDFQAKVQGGYRVELSEVEFHFKSNLNRIPVVAVGYTNRVGNTEIGVVLESMAFDTTSLMNKLSKQMPKYMMPSQVKFVEEFPLNQNGKIDRKALCKLFS